MRRLRDTPLSVVPEQRLDAHGRARLQERE
jgi:hypothetical protein